MNWSTAIPSVAAILGGCGVLLKGMSWLANAWRDKAVAEALKARAFEALTLEVAEMRKTMANYLTRIGEAESDIKSLQDRNALQTEWSAAHGVVQR